MAALRAVSIDLTMGAGAADADVVHSHTWYANLGGHLAKLLYGIPHVTTAHCLEPLRPWKRSSSAAATRCRVLRADGDRSAGRRGGRFARHGRRHPAPAIPRSTRAGARDPQRHRHAALPTRPRTDAGALRHRPRAGPMSCSSAGSRARRARPSRCGRPARSTPRAQLVLCAGAPDTPEIGAEIAGGGDRAEARA